MANFGQRLQHKFYEVCAVHLLSFRENCNLAFSCAIEDKLVAMAPADDLDVAERKRLARKQKVGAVETKDLFECKDRNVDAFQGNRRGRNRRQKSDKRSKSGGAARAAWVLCDGADVEGSDIGE
jgi:hypothetical protein